MKINLMLAFPVSLLLLVSCRDEEQDTSSLNTGTYQAPLPLSRPSLHPVLDSFQRSYSATLPSGFRSPGSFRNRYKVRRDRDSMTVSGAVFAQEGHRSLTAYRFYFRSSGKYCYAYLKRELLYPSADRRQQRMNSREAGFCLRLADRIRV